MYWIAIIDGTLTFKYEGVMDWPKAGVMMARSAGVSGIGPRLMFAWALEYMSEQPKSEINPASVKYFKLADVGDRVKGKFSIQGVVDHPCKKERILKDIDQVFEHKGMRVTFRGRFSAGILPDNKIPEESAEARPTTIPIPEHYVVTFDRMIAKATGATAQVKQESPSTSK